jgi:prepilin-type N-terminal cleavage/methylation domain-containing protein
MKKNKGVTLIELIVSIVIFAAVITGIAVFNSNNTRAIIYSERSAKRAVLQEKTIEEFRGWLKSGSVPGSRFDTLWTYSSVGAVLFPRTDSTTGISVSLEIDSFIPDQATDVASAGVQLQIRVISTDTELNIYDTVITYVSRHD